MSNVINADRCNLHDQSYLSSQRFFFIDFRERKGRGGGRMLICCSTYLCIHWMILVCALIGNWTHSCGVMGWCSREKETITYKGVPIRLSADFSKETLQARRGWKEVFQVMKGKDLHPRLLYAAKLSFRMEGQVKYFLDKVKLKEFIIAKPLL